MTVELTRVDVVVVFTKLGDEKELRDIPPSLKQSIIFGITVFGPFVMTFLVIGAAFVVMRIIIKQRYGR